MRKHQAALIAAALVGAVALPQVSATETLLKRVEHKGLEAFLPPVTTRVPWLDVDRRTKLPKGDYPIGWDSPGPTALQLAPFNQHADLAEFALGGS